MTPRPKIGFAELLRRGVKWTIFYIIASGDTARYMALRAKTMVFLGMLGIYERANLKALSRFVNTGDIVVDVGAHFGVYTRELSKLVSHRGRVHAFEPQTLVYQSLSSIKFPFENVNLYPIALSNANAEEVFLRVPFIAGGVPEPALATLEEIDAPHMTCSMKVRTLNSYKKELTGVKFIKVDVEGHETTFLDGAREVIIENRPVIQIEDNSGGVILSEYLKETPIPGYGLFVLNGQGELESVVLGGDSKEINFYLIPTA